MALSMGLLLLAVLALANAQDDTGSGPPGPYNSMQAMETRDLHFYCLGEGGTAANFPTDIPQENSDMIQTYVRWTVFLQYPVLSYLDSMRKPELIRRISNIVGRPADEFCIATVQNYQVSYYDESVLVSFYFLNTPGDPNTVDRRSPEIMRINTAFQDAVRSASATNFRSFLGRTAIIVGNQDMRSGQPNENVHPGAVMDVYDPALDPTLNAVPIASFIGNVTLDEVLSRRSDWIQEFADNPNPRTLGLEAGDIIFAVFGSIFLVILTIAIFMGYCIHPFFLS